MNRHLKHSGAAASFVILLGFAGVAFPIAPAEPQATDPAPQQILADPMVKAPYLLFPGARDQMKVLWQLSVTATSTIEWGTDLSYTTGSAQNDEYGSDHQHAYTITGLVPVTKYYYRVTTQGFSRTGSFLSAPEPDATRLEFMVYGDTRSNPGTHDNVARAMLSAIAADPAYQALVLNAGDDVSDGGSESAWTSEWFDPFYANIRALTASAPYAGCVGNHEMSSGSTLFTKYFPYPFAGSRYYSFNYGPAHFTVLDQYTSYDSTSTQGKWFKNDLAATTRPWKFVLLHEPGWSAAGGHSNNTTVQQQIEPFCERFGVAIVFGGHNHYYSRAVVNTVQHVTTGGGGAPLYSPQSGQSHIVARSGTNHFCKVVIDGGVLSCQAISAQGARIDSFSIARTTATTIAMFDAVMQNQGVLLRWEFGSLVSVVDVERSPRLDGPWTPVTLEPVVEGERFEGLDRGADPDGDWYRITATFGDGTRSMFGPVRAERADRVTRSGLGRVAPNPFSRTTRIEYVVGQRENVRLSVVDIAGREVERLAQGVMEAGRYTATWDARKGETPLPVGVYFLRWESPRMVMQKRVALVR
jgi:calcineurin-like phosphoesterase family protein/purple acid phosphatase-like protein